MTSKIQKWGNSLALRIPKVFVKDIHLGRGTEVEISIKNGKMIIAPVQQNLNLSDLIKRIQPDNLHKEIQTGSPRGSEIW